jgi:hypothetical protein
MARLDLLPLARGPMRIICVPMLFSRKNSIWKDVSPKGAVTDFIAVFRDAGPNRWRIACWPPVARPDLLAADARRAPHSQRLPTITYINSWREGRSDAEIEAGNIANQKLKKRKPPRPPGRSGNPRPLQGAGPRIGHGCGRHRGQGQGR